MIYMTVINDRSFEIEILEDGSLMVNGKKRVVDFTILGRTSYSILSEGESHTIFIDERDGNIDVLMQGGRLYSARVMDERAILMAHKHALEVDASLEVQIKAPMPGLVVTIKVTPGQEVEAGQTIVILESMKMQNELKTPRAGVVNQINVAAGEAVEQNKVMVTIT